MTCLAGRAIGTRLRLHTWVACVVAVISVVLVIASSVNVTPRDTSGCLLALGGTLTFASYAVLSGACGARGASASPCTAFGGALASLVALAVINTRSSTAAPATPLMYGLAVANGVSVGFAQAFLFGACAYAPPIEIAAAAMLEPIFSPVLVFLVTLPHPQIPDNRCGRRASSFCCFFLTFPLFTTAPSRRLS